MGFIKWLTEPLANIIESIKTTTPSDQAAEEESNVEFKYTDEQVIKPIGYSEFVKGQWRWVGPKPEETAQDNSIKNVQEAQSTNTSIYRPDTFGQYIGQEQAKDVLKSYVNATKTRGSVFPHTLIHGHAGCGKTTLARIIAKELGVEFVEHITSGIVDFSTLIECINKTNGGVLFLDEVHSLSRDMCERLYSVMEDFAYNGRPIKPFTLIGATTEVGEIIKSRKPFYDRFKIILELEKYTTNDLKSIVKQYKNKLFLNDTVTEEVYQVIADNARNTPRYAIRLLEATIYLNGDCKRTLKNFNILKEGYTIKDLKVLEYFAQSTAGIGVNAISSYLNTSTQNYLYEIEPYLTQNGLVMRTPRGRKITDSGKLKMEELKKC